MDFGLIILWIVVLGIWYLYKLAYLNEHYFEEKNVVHEKPLPFIGNVWNFIRQKQNIQTVLNKLYKKFKGER